MAKKRQLPAHIVLPNGMWRFVKKGAKKIKAVSKSRRVKKVSSKRRVNNMARYRKHRSTGSKGLGLGGISLKGILVGMGGATLSDNLGLSNAVPYGKYIAGAGAGKIAKTGVLSGVIGVFARDMVKGNVLGQVSGAGAVPLY